MVVPAFPSVRSCRSESRGDSMLIMKLTCSFLLAADRACKIGSSLTSGAEKARGRVGSLLEIALARFFSRTSLRAGSVRQLLAGGLAIARLKGSSDAVRGRGGRFSDLVEWGLLRVWSYLLLCLIDETLTARIGHDDY